MKDTHGFSRQACPEQRRKDVKTKVKTVSKAQLKIKKSLGVRCLPVLWQTSASARVSLSPVSRMAKRTLCSPAHAGDSLIFLAKKICLPPLTGSDIFKPQREHER